MKTKIVGRILCYATSEAMPFAADCMPKGVGRRDTFSTRTTEHAREIREAVADLKELILRRRAQTHDAEPTRTAADLARMNDTELLATFGKLRAKTMQCRTDAQAAELAKLNAEYIRRYYANGAHNL